MCPSLFLLILYKAQLFSCIYVSGVTIRHRAAPQNAGRKTGDGELRKGQRYAKNVHTTYHLPRYVELPRDTTPHAKQLIRATFFLHEPAPPVVFRLLAMCCCCCDDFPFPYLIRSWVYRAWRVCLVCFKPPPLPPEMLICQSSGTARGWIAAFAALRQSVVGGYMTIDNIRALRLIAVLW